MPLSGHTWPVKTVRLTDLGVHLIQCPYPTDEGMSPRRGRDLPEEGGRSEVVDNKYLLSE